ncbi:MAG TPA: SDR family NAD(P)-dependent oxidoreductase [Bacillota bacterium]|nr:SDR family NAD(P)-dependent oxidoreductase [Bacillota bacterium]
MEAKAIGLDSVKLNIRETKEELHLQEVSSDEIAIIGISVKLPLADTPDEYWANIVNKVDCVRKFPEKRAEDANRYFRYRSFKEHEEKYLEGSYLEEIDKFDYSFFHFSPKEACLMNPIQRLFLETVWSAIEDAGYGGNQLNGSDTGVYLGFISDLEGYKYKEMLLDIDPQSLPLAAAGNLSTLIPSRIAYLMNLKGPSLLVDTACSSSLVAVYLACQALRNGNCKMAIAGGVKVNLLPLDKEYYKIGIESSDGATRAFDDDADGSGMGEGVVAIVLKPFQKAKQDRDHIYAVIKGAAINQDGASMGITAPNPEAQTEALIKAWQDARINPETISYIETHGTGTNLGDPVEITGIENAFRRYTQKKQFCAISSVKSNLGHLYDCAGIAGLLKAVYALNHQILPPSIYFNRPNRKINFMESPVYVNSKPRKWEKSEHPRRCGVSSFGISGTNCHLVLEESPISGNLSEHPADRLLLITISAKSPNALKQLVEKYAELTNREQKYPLEDICYTANTGREHHQYRLALIVSSRGDLQSKLRRLNQAEWGTLAETDIFYGSFQPSNPKTAKEERGLAKNSPEKLNQTLPEKIQKFISTGKKDHQLLSQICNAYINGATIDWNEFYKGELLNRLSLPCYPFDRTRCWLEIPEVQANLNQSSNLYYSMVWKPDELIPSSQAPSQGTILVLKDSKRGLGAAIMKKLLDTAGTEVKIIEAEIGSQFQKVDPGKYILSAQAGDYEKLIEALQTERLTQIIHLWTLDNPETVAGPEELEASQNRGVYSLFHLIQAILKHDLKNNIEIIIVSDDVNDVTGEEKKIKFTNAPLVGLGKVVSQEYSELLCRAIDIDDEVTVDQLYQEIYGQNPYYQIAFRNGKRYVEEFESLELNQFVDRRITIQSEGVYLITGGIGGMGLEVAKYLVLQHPQVKIALINRSRLPERPLWEKLITDTPEGDVSQKLKFILEMEAIGAQIDCCCADVSNLTEIEAVINGLRLKYGKINGIVHCAGVAGNGFIIRKTQAKFSEVLRPKIMGTWNLDRVTQSDALDFFVMFSSGVSIIGEPGQGDYTAANSFLDIFAALRRRQGKPALTINWVIWKETGMAVIHGLNRDGIFKALPTHQAIEAFNNVLNKDITRLLIGEINYGSEMLAQMEKPSFKLSPEIKMKIGALEGQIATRLTLPHKKVNAVKAIKLAGRKQGDYTRAEKDLAEICKEILGVAEINIYDSFFELGADSIQLKQMHLKLAKKYPGAVTVADIFAYPSISQLAQHIAVRKQDQPETVADVTRTLIEQLFDDLENGKITVKEAVHSFRGN